MSAFAPMRSLKLTVAYTLLFLIVNVILAAITNVPRSVTLSDETVFRTIYKFDQPKYPLEFDEQIQLIKKVVAVVLDRAPAGDPIPEFQTREPEDLIRHQSGLCYDRSRTLDKFLSWLGFETRHVFILYLEHPVTGEELSPLRAMLTRGSATHAVTEVRTQRGWIVVDSNLNWISLSRDDQPIDADDIFLRRGDFNHLPDTFNRPYIAIRGMYSRHGKFYKPYIPFPELNWNDFLYWLVIE